MERGFVKLWHRLKDSKCYSRGGVHRALLLTLFTEANWKEGYFRGETILPGQFATSVLGLSQELGFPKTTVQRALSDLVSDGVVTVENMGNRWTRITLVNWATYQPVREESGQPTGNPRATDGSPVDTIKDVKKKDIKENTSYSLSESPDSDGCPPCPHGKILELYAEVLPHHKQVRTWRTAHQSSLKARWREKWKEGLFVDEESGMAYFKRLFDYVKRNKVLDGRMPSRDGREPWQADLKWIIKAANFDKIMERTYDKYLDDVHP